MKKMLFGTTALLAAGAFASAAQASDPIKLQLGGYMEYYFIAADQDSSYKGNVNSFDVQGDSEVWFKGSTTLDNGMVIGVQVELEAGSNSNTTDTIDESYLWLEGKYGKAIVGSENDAAYLMHVNGPDAGFIGGQYSGSEADTIRYLPFSVGGAKANDTVSYIEQISKYTGDANKITYFTPKFYGVQAGVSYIPSGASGGDDAIDSVGGDTVIKGSSSFDDAWAFGLTYAGEVAGVGIKASSGLMTASVNAGGVAGAHGNVTEITGGLNVSYMGFTLGGGVNRRIAAAETLQGATDGFAWDAALMYAEGPYAVSLGYATSKVEGTLGNGKSDEVGVWRLGANYVLGPGVIAFSEIAYNATVKDEGSSTNTNEGAIGGAVGLRLNF